MDAATATVIAAVAATIGVVIGSVITILGNHLNNRYQLRLQREQLDRQDKREQIDRDLRAKESELVEQARLRGKLQDIYADGIQTLSALEAGYNTYSAQLRIEHIKDTQKALALIMIHHYDKKDGFGAFVNNQEDLIRDGELNTSILDELRQAIIAFAVNDPRLK